MTHYDDTVPHNPVEISGYKHAGHEVWYKNEDPADPTYKTCENVEGAPESKECSNSLWFQLGVNAHRYYLGYLVSGQCAELEPGLLGDSLVFNQAQRNEGGYYSSGFLGLF